jgi:hypothetical protein
VGRLAPAQPRPRWPAGTAGCLVVAAGVELLARELGRLSGADSRAFVGELARGAPLHVLLSSLEVGQGIFDRLELVFGGVRQVLEDAGRRVYRPAIYGFLVRELDGAGLFRGVVGLVHLHHPDWLGMALVSPDVASAVADAAVATNDLGLARVLVEHAETDTLLESIIAYDSLGMATWLANLDIDGFMRALAAVGAEFAISARLLPVIQRATQLVTVDYEFTAFGDSDGDSSDSSDSDGDDRLRCCVCRGRRDRGRLACGHVMCDGCATSWAARTRAQMSCPLCRRPLARAI